MENMNCLLLRLKFSQRNKERPLYKIFGVKKLSYTAKFMNFYPQIQNIKDFFLKNSNTWPK